MFIRLIFFLFQLPTICLKQSFWIVLYYSFRFKFHFLILKVETSRFNNVAISCSIIYNKIICHSIFIICYQRWLIINTEIKLKQREIYLRLFYTFTSCFRYYLIQNLYTTDLVINNSLRISANLVSCKCDILNMYV